MANRLALKAICQQGNERVLYASIMVSFKKFIDCLRFVRLVLWQISVFEFLSREPSGAFSLEAHYFSCERFDGFPKEGDSSYFFLSWR